MTWLAWLFLGTTVISALCALRERLIRLRTRDAMKELLQRSGTALARRGVPGRKIAQQLVPEHIRKSLKLQDNLKK